MEREVTAVIRSWERAIQQGDIDGILANHPHDVLMFDVPAPIQIRGIDAYRKTWSLFYQYGKPSPDVFVIENLEVTSSDTVAFATGLLRIGGSKEPICRLTLGLKKVDGQWLITHEHHSGPDKSVSSA